ncbi:hypothetical protein AB1E18_011686 [Capra hircus]
MKLNNNVTDFILLGLSQCQVRKKTVFVTFLFLHLGTLLGNFLIISTIKTSRTLGSPMYFFLFHLSLSDTFLSTSIAPRVIANALRGKSTISSDECMTQVFASLFFDCLEIFILILMAVDHYLAICQILLAFSLPFCGPSVIGHYLCNLQSLLKLACTHTYVTNLLLVSNSGAICTVSFVTLMFSYAIILHSLRNHSAEGRKKALSTCISNIIVVILFFGPCTCIYPRPATIFPMDKMIAVFYTVETPLINPLIYTLRNTEVEKCRENVMGQETDHR